MVFNLNYTIEKMPKTEKLTLNMFVQKVRKRVKKDFWHIDVTHKLCYKMTDFRQDE